MEGQNNTNFGDSQSFQVPQRAWPYREYTQQFNDGAFNFSSGPYQPHYPPVPNPAGDREVVVDPRLQGSENAAPQLNEPQEAVPEQGDDDSSKKKKGGRPRKEPLPPPPAPEPEPKKEDPRIRYSTIERLHVLALLGEGMKIAYVSERTGVPQMTVRRIGKKAAQRGYRPEEDARILEKYVIDGKITGRPKRKAKEMEGGEGEPETGADEEERDVDGGADTEGEGEGGDAGDTRGLFSDALEGPPQQ